METNEEAESELQGQLLDALKSRFAIVLEQKSTHRQYCTGSRQTEMVTSVMLSRKAYIRFLYCLA